MITVEDGEMLAKVQTYELNRGKEKFLIDVYEIVAGGDTPFRYWAFPNLIFVKGRRRYFGKGNTEKEALRDCLRRVRSASLEEIFPDLDEDDPKGPAEVVQIRL
ncbi:hypothetical protein SAMN02745206_03335 [Desulfacinum infernum DSM 9756]|uniref:Uncharacterized protein n=1 Tax=Desulfacinum infernum DSM 9756 TaxID=1121391 RepID=A0A1M5HCY3_9BACT|nr:hypothetical protein [Desulfacinum infernum]SHG13849.1 hypothetical protein SAMN02745206_03335 [Desulfacinum infernum DSM 9756]